MRVRTVLRLCCKHSLPSHGALCRSERGEHKTAGPRKSVWAAAVRFPFSPSSTISRGQVSRIAHTATQLNDVPGLSDSRSS